jgi:hypothetical protein
MREREATESAATETAGSSRAAGVRDLRTLASQLGNAAFGKLMRTPLSDAIHAAGTGGWAPVFALLAHLNANQTNQRLRALDTADLVALRSHLGEAPAADRPRISTALDLLLLWGDADATAMGNRYRTAGTYAVTETGDTRQTHDYAVWRGRAVRALQGKPAAVRAAGLAWLGAHEAHEDWVLRGSTPPEPPAAGALPASFTAIGAPPTPSMRKVHRYDITLPGSATAYSYRDDPVAPSYRYLISETGVGRAGTRLSARTDAAAIFTAAGIADATVRKVMTKVSSHEGGLEAVNTYDTGYISIGFIQFTTGREGTGSLIRVLREMKTSNAADFDTYFHSMGIDVDAVGLTAVDPATGTIKRGAAAVQAVMDDKRLTAVFQRAGTDSRSFQAAQVKRAHDEYYHGPQSFTVTQGAVTITGTYQQVLTSEAGKTAMMDRAVQRGVGNARNTFRDACKAVITAHPTVTTLAQLAAYEVEIIPRLVNRIQVLTETDLSQPPAAPVAAVTP